MNRKLLLGVLALLIVGTGGITFQRAWAYGIPTTNPLVYSGTLLNNGAPVDGDKFILIKVWNGAQIACSTIPSGNTAITQGRFSIPLDATCIDVVHQHPDVQLEVVVDGQSLGKSALSAVPYAIEADTASNPAPGSAIEALVPAGTIVAYGGTVGTPPPGWLYCDGSSISRTQYQRLFLAIGTAWGADPSDNSKFNLPDLRGRFLRGVDDGVGRDPDATARTASNPGGNPGAAVGTIQPEQFRSHRHRPLGGAGGAVGTLDPSQGNVFGGLTAAAGAEQAATGYRDINAFGRTYIENSGGAETRPINAAVNYIIKY